MAAWPTQTEFETWISNQDLTLSSTVDRVPFAFAAAVETVQNDVTYDLFPTYDEDDAPDVYDADTNPTGYHVPDRVRLAVFILAHRLLVRADSPSGVIGFSEFAIRVGNDDPDYMMLIRAYWVPGIA